MSPFDELVEALKPFARITVEGRDHTQFAEAYPVLAKNIEAARRALTRAAEGPDDETVERVASAIYAAFVKARNGKHPDWSALGVGDWDGQIIALYRSYARAAISALTKDTP